MKDSVDYKYSHMFSISYDVSRVQTPTVGAVIGQREFIKWIYFLAQ